MTYNRVAWEHDNVFNPAAVVAGGKVYVLFRAEDNAGQGIGNHTSRIGIAVSKDGSHFTASDVPVLYPSIDDQKAYDWPGGCEDPRIVEGPHGYVLTYTAWNRKIARLSVATSPDLRNWEKRGPAFERAYGGKFLNTWSKSGSIVTKLAGNRLVAAKIQGKYWMYFGEGEVSLATSTDLVQWTPLVDSKGDLLRLLSPREDRFDSALAECGPPALLTKDGIVLIYNGKNAEQRSDTSIPAGAYSAGQALFSADDPSKLIDRTDQCFFKPERPYEATGQYKSGTVFVEGLVRFKDRWRLYYGTADSRVAVAATP
jgi:predicted GH43/DUF377 family glycosyl hydrolase